MRYVYESGRKRRVMHIERFTFTGDETMRALCGIPIAFDRSINAPFGLGRTICKRCEARLREETKP